MRQSSHLWLDLKIWCSCKDDLGRWCTIHILWEVLCSLLNIICSRTTSFQPQSNSLVERFHCSLKTSLCAQLAGPDWFDHLPLVMLGLHSVPCDDSGFSAAKALYGDPLCLPGEFLDSDELPPAVFQDRIPPALRSLVLPFHHHQPPSTAKVPDSLALADFVFVREDASLCPLSQLYQGPFKVLACSSKFFTLWMDSRTNNVSINHGPDPVPHDKVGLLSLLWLRFR